MIATLVSLFWCVVLVVLTGTFLMSCLVPALKRDLSLGQDDIPQTMKVSSQSCPRSWDPTLKTDLGDFSAELQMVSLTHATDVVTTQLHPSPSLRSPLGAQFQSQLLVLPHMPL